METWKHHEFWDLWCHRIERIAIWKSQGTYYHKKRPAFCKLPRVNNPIVWLRPWKFTLVYLVKLCWLVQVSITQCFRVINQHYLLHLDNWFAEIPVRGWDESKLLLRSLDLWLQKVIFPSKTAASDFWPTAGFRPERVVSFGF